MVILINSFSLFNVFMMSFNARDTVAADEVLTGGQWLLEASERQQ